jgi:fibronectin-binding autotransporter adhesin
MGTTRTTFLRLLGTPSRLALAVRCGLLAPLLGVAIAPAQATDYYWDINGILSGSGGPMPNGTWSTTVTTLSLDAAGTAAVLPQTTTTADGLFFSAGTDAIGAYTVTVSGTQNIGRLTFQEGAVSLTGGTINFGSASGLIDGDATPDSISATLSGTNGVRFSGGTVTLNGAVANTYTGTTQVGGFGLAQARVTLSATGGNAISGNFLQIGGNNGTSAGFVTLGAADQINDTATVQLNSGHYSGSSIFSMNGFDETLGGIGLHHQGEGSGVVFRNGAATDATVTLAGAGTYTTASGDRVYGRSIQDGGTGDLNVVVALTGTGSQTFAGTDPTYTGTTTITSGTLRLWNTSVWASNATLNGGTLELQQTSAGTGTLAGAASRTHASTIGGTGGTLRKTGNGTVILSGANTYQGATSIQAGTLQAGSTSAFGSNSAVTLANVAGATLNLNGFNNSIGSLAGGGAAGGNVFLGAANMTAGGNNTSTSYAGTISGAGALTKTGAGTLALTGANSYAGATTVAAGTLRINGSLATSPVTANAGSTLGGSGTMGGPVTITAGATLDAGPTAGTVGTLSMGALTLDAGSQLTYDLGEANVVGGPNNDLVQVNGNLTLGGVVNVNTGSIFANTLLPGSYRLINYTGTLSGNAAIGSIPSGFATSQIQTVIPGEVNLIAVQNGVPVQFWDGADTTGNGVLDGGTGTWNNSTGNWTNATGSINQSWVPGVGIVTGTAGIVTIAEPVSAMGLQFISDGYQVTSAGSALTMVARPDGSMPFIRVDPGATADIGAPIAGTAGLLKADAGTLVLTGTNTYTGGTVISGGTLQLGNGGATGSIVGDITDDGALVFDRSGALTIGGVISGSGPVTQAGPGTTILSGTNSYAGGTTITGGTLQLGSGGATGSITGDVLNNGVLAFNRNNTYAFDGLISGSGVVEQLGSGATILAADNSYAGETNVREGTLIVNGDQSAATGTTTVEAGGALGGIGTIGGDVVVQDNGALNPGNLGTTPGTLTINGNLALGANATLNYNFGQAGVVGGADNDLTVVHGHLVLDGSLNVAETPGGNFGPGIYRVVSYDGSLTDFGLSESSPNHIVQTSVAGQVNLIDISGMTLNYWDGDVGPKDNFLVDGGDGIWRAADDDNWTDDNGEPNATFTNSSFAIFAGAAGTVDVDNTSGQVLAAGMQFATDGYLIQGDNITLVGPQSTIRAGDGTLPGAAYVATIASALQGSSQLVKTDLGTLVLTGNNTYTGGIRINQGTLQFSSDANLGDAAGDLTLDGGTLRNTAAIVMARGTTLEDGGGTFLTDADLTLNGAIGGPGGFTKTGSAALTLTGNNSYSGSAAVSAGNLYVNGNQSGATGPTSVANGATLGGTGTLGGSVTVADGATLSPGVANGTPGTLTVAGNLTLFSASILDYSLGQANVPGGTLNDLTTVGGNLVLDGTLNVSVPTSGTFGPGVYRVFNYAGTLTNNGLTVGTIPSAGYFVQTAIAQQVNLVNTAGLNLNYWDGDAGPKFDGVINGGDGTWQSSAGNDNWTESTGVVNAPYSDGSFAIFAGKAGTVTVDNSLGQVTASGMQVMTDGYIIQGRAVSLIGPASTIRVGDGTNAGAGITATIASELTGSSQLAKTDLGTLVLTGTNSYTGGTAINGGTLQVSSNANLGDASGGLSFDGGTLHATSSFASGRAISMLGQGTLLTDAGTTLTLAGTLTGRGSLLKDGDGTTVIAADASGLTGTMSVEDGTLAVNGSLCGDISVRDGGRLQGTGTVCDTNNFAGGTVAPGNSIGTLTIAGDYTGSGGTLEIEAELAGDASPTDRLVVTGNTSGTSNVEVINLGGGGAQTVEGIKIIDVGGASNGTFTLLGDYVFQGQQAVVGGAFAYRLYKDGVSTPADGDWYLRSAHLNPDDPDPQPLFQPGVPLYEAYAGALQSFNELGTLQQRVGNRMWGGAATPQGADLPSAAPVDGRAIWTRIEAAHAEFDPETSTSGTTYGLNTWRLQAGVDGLLTENGAGALIGGATVHYGTVSSDISSIFGTGSIDATGYGFGGTLTWLGNSGFYVDAQAQATWYDSDLTSATLGTTLADGNDGFGYALSLEAGQKVALSNNWSLTPQAQLGYSSVDFDDFTDPFGATVSLEDNDQLIGRLGVSADYEDQWVDAAGQVGRTHVYGIANLYYDFLDGSRADVSGTDFISENQALWGGLGVGGTLSWADGRYAVFGEALARTSLEDFGDSYDLGAKLGFSVKW